jgi:hypothetical protein
VQVVHIIERELIRERTRAGLAAARARGRRGGRPSLLTVDKLRTARRLYEQRDMTVEQIGNVLGVSRTTVYRALGADVPPVPAPHRAPAGRTVGRPAAAKAKPTAAVPPPPAAARPADAAAGRQVPKLAPTRAPGATSGSGQAARPTKRVQGRWRVAEHVRDETPQSHEAVVLGSYASQGSAARAAARMRGRQTDPDIVYSVVAE